MRQGLTGLRLVPLILALAVVLSACGFSTDTVATVGGQRITRGELNAAVQAANADAARTAALQGGRPAVVTPTDVLQDLIIIRQLELVARNNGVQVTDADIKAENERLVSDFVDGGKQLQDQNLARLIGQKAAEIRPIVNAYGGGAIPNTELQAVLVQEIERMRGLLASRGTQVSVGSEIISERMVEDQAIAFRNALAGRGVGIPPQELEPTVADLLQQLSSGTYLAADPDLFQQVFALQYGDDRATYQQLVRIRAMLEKLRPRYAPAEIETLVVQELRTDSQGKALEAIQKGRAGTPFAELLSAYQLPGVQIGANDNTLPNPLVPATNPNLQAAIKTVQAGAYSEPIATADNRQFLVYRIVRVEKRAPTEQEANPFFGPWFEAAIANYPPTYVDMSLAPPPVPR